MATYKSQGTYLLVTFQEPYALQSWIAAIRLVPEHCQNADLYKVLVDIRSSSGSPSTVERYELGVQIAAACGSRIQAAVIARPDEIDHMGETVAVNRGANMKVFSDLKQALEWLEVE